MASQVSIAPFYRRAGTKCGDRDALLPLGWPSARSGGCARHSSGRRRTGGLTDDRPIASDSLPHVRQRPRIAMPPIRSPVRPLVAGEDTVQKVLLFMKLARAGLLAGGTTVTTFALAGLFVPASAAESATVCATGCDYTTVQDAVDAASNGDVITVRGPLTVSGTTTINKDVTVTGA